MHTACPACTPRRGKFEPFGGLKPVVNAVVAGKAPEPGERLQVQPPRPGLPLPPNLAWPKYLALQHTLQQAKEAYGPFSTLGSCPHMPPAWAQGSTTPPIMRAGAGL